MAKDINLPMLEEFEIDKRVWLYTRFSTDKNQDMASQLALARNYCKEKGWIIDQEFTDPYRSGQAAENRPAFMEMVASASITPRTATMIVFRDYNRFGRNQYDNPYYRNYFRKRKFKIHVINGTIPIDSEYGPLLEAVSDLQGAQYIKDVQANTKSGLRYIAESGCIPVGQIPVGYSVVKIPIGHKNGEPRFGRKPVLDEIFAPRVVYAFQLKLEGASHQGILQETGLFQSGEDTPVENGEKMAHMPGSLESMFRNRIYIGEFQFQEEIFTNIYPPIVSIALFDAVQRVMKPSRVFQKVSGDNGMTITPGHKHGDFFIADIAYCGYCSAHMEGKSIRADPYKYRYYICSQHNERSSMCPNSKLIDADWLEKELFESTRDHVLIENYMKQLLVWTNNQVDSQEEIMGLRIAETESRFKQAVSNNQKLHQNFGLIFLEDIMTKEAKRLLVEADDLANHLEQELSNLKQTYDQRHVNWSDKQINQFLSGTFSLLQNGNVNFVRAVYKRLISKIEMFQDKVIVYVHFPV